MAAAAGIPIIGGIFAAQGASEDAAAKSQAARYNANVAGIQADQAIQQSAEDVRQQKIQAQKLIGNAQANYGSSGVDSASGSAMDVLNASARSAEMDSLNIKHAGDMKAWALRAGGVLDNMQGAAAANAGKWGVASALFGAGTQAYSMSGGRSSSWDDE